MPMTKTSRLAVLTLVGLGALLGFVVGQSSTDPSANVAASTVSADGETPNSQAQEFAPELSLALPIKETPLEPGDAARMYLPGLTAGVHRTHDQERQPRKELLMLFRHEVANGATSRRLHLVPYSEPGLNPFLASVKW